VKPARPRGRAGEFELIARYFAPLARSAPAHDLKDDAAHYTPRAETRVVLTVDAIVEGVHFLADDPPAHVARKALRVNLSDLAAKAARPVGYLLVLQRPRTLADRWIARFADGLAEDQRQYRIGLWGGDTVSTDGPLSISITAIGEAAAAQPPLLRSGALAGDVVYVTGTIGDAHLGLRALKGELASLKPAHRMHFVHCYRLPEPRLELAPFLARVATAAMDVSDGLVADLGHIADASKLSAELELGRLPLSAAARAYAGDDAARRLALATGGDDYEILFTAAPGLGAEFQIGGIPVTAVGRMGLGRGVQVRDPAGRPMRVRRTGWQHG
jgi:thiamine-monophosphate kinase